MTLDPRAAGGFASTADAYDDGRPSYPARSIAQLARELRLDHASTVLDLAAGTGKLTARLLPHVGRVVAVEPSAAMLEKLRRSLPLVDAREGTAEQIPCVDRSIDAVFVGEAFHWFDVDRAAGEIARVLQPGGGLALLWNDARWDERELPWLPAFEALVRPLRDAAGDFPAEDWRARLDRTRLFAPLHQRHADHEHRLRADQFIALVSSWSWIANLPYSERAALLMRVRGLLDERATINLRYRTQIYHTRRSP